MRLIGMGLVLISGGLLGFSQAFRYEEILDNMQRLIELLNYLIGQIKTEGNTLPEAICKVSARQSEAVGEFLQNTAKKIRNNEGKEFCLIWEEEMAKLPLQLPLKIKKEWIHMFRQTGFYDSDGQLQQLLYVQKKIMDEKRAMELQKKDQCRLYRSMGFFISLFLVILLW